MSNERKPVNIDRRIVTIAPFVTFSARALASDQAQSAGPFYKSFEDGLPRQNLPSGETVDLTGRDIVMRDVTIASAGRGASVVVGGRVDPTVKIVLKTRKVTAGSRYIDYELLIGALLPEQWVYVSGHLEGAWTTNGGRVCEVGYLCRVREIDKLAKRIHLYHYIPESLDSESVDDGNGKVTSYELSAIKVLPCRVDLSGVRLDRVTLEARYLIDSSLDVRLGDGVHRSFSVNVSVANNVRIKVNSVASSTSAAGHSLVLQNIYGGKIDFQASAANYSNIAKSEKMIAKCLRANGLIHCDVYSQVIGAGLWANTVHCMIGGRFVAYTADPGAYNTDNYVRTNNRNDANNFVYLRRGAQIDITAIELDSTGLEVFGARDSEIIGCHLSKTRADNSNSDCGMLSIKGICRNLTIRGFNLFARGDRNQAVRLEFHDVHRGLYQQGIMFIEPVINCDGHGIMTRGMYTLTTTSITGVDGVATVVAPKHQLSHGMRVRFSGFTEPTYEGEFDVAIVDADTFTVSVPKNAPPAPTGAGSIVLLMDAKISILGGYIKASRPIFTDRNISDVTLDGSIIEVELEPEKTTGVLPGHAVVLLGGGAKLRNISILGTDGALHRAVSCERADTTLENVRSDGGVFFQSGDLGKFNPALLHNVNMQVHLGGQSLVLYPERDGNFALDTSSTNQLAALDVRAWPDNFFLRERGALKQGMGWVLRNRTWIRTSG